MRFTNNRVQSRQAWQEERIVMSINNLETSLDHLSHAEKVRMFQRLALDLTHAWPGVEKTPGGHGGDACIVRTRIPI
jgi:hypothetical protein